MIYVINYTFCAQMGVLSDFKGVLIKNASNGGHFRDKKRENRDKIVHDTAQVRTEI